MTMKAEWRGVFSLKYGNATLHAVGETLPSSSRVTLANGSTSESANLSKSEYFLQNRRVTRWLQHINAPFEVLFFGT